MMFTMKNTLIGVLLCLALGNALGDVTASSEDFLKAPDRIEWQAGGLYDGRFEDGTRFQIQLAYTRPAAAPEGAVPFAEAYWYPKHYKYTVFVLTDAGRTADTLHLVLQAGPDSPVEESFSIALTPDLLSGSGTWTSAKLKKQMAFSLQRAIPYEYVAVQRPAPPEALKGDPERRFMFGAWFPVLGDADADAWIREEAGKCSGDLECMNEVQVRWKSGALLSLNASVWEYNYHAAHGNGGSTTRQYGVDRGRLVPLGLDAFIDTGASCVSKLTAGIVEQLHAQELPWADDWAKYAPLKNKWLKFTPTASGIAFHFDPYEVAPYMNGAPSVFLTRAQLGTCLRHLPAAD
jgi:hypothetical protein